MLRPLHEYPVLEVAVDKVWVYEADALPVVVGVPKDLNQVGVLEPRQFSDLVVERLVRCGRSHGGCLLVQALHGELYFAAKIPKCWL